MPMHVIHKHQLHVRRTPTTLSLPSTTTLLHLGAQDAEIMLWTMHEVGDTSAIERQFIVIPTGEPFRAERTEHVGTVQIAGFVWHVFEVPTP